MVSSTEKMAKKRRELIAAYVPTGTALWRRVYPETFYADNSFIEERELGYINLVHEILRAAIDNQRRTLIEDEINLMYMEIERKATLGKFSQEVVSAIQGRLKLKKQTLQQIESLGLDVESKFSDYAKSPPDVRFRLESTIYLVRLLAYGLFSDNDIVLERVAEVFDIEKLQAATKPKDRRNMNSTLKFLYRGLIQKNDRGRQGNRHAARQTISTMREWYSENEYVTMCIDKIAKYV